MDTIKQDIKDAISVMDEKGRGTDGNASRYLWKRDWDRIRSWLLDALNEYDATLATARQEGWDAGQDDMATFLTEKMTCGHPRAVFADMSMPKDCQWCAEVEWARREGLEAAAVECDRRAQEAEKSANIAYGNE